MAEAGYHPDFGARSLQRTILRDQQDALALKVLAGEFKEGDTIQVNRSAHGPAYSMTKSVIHEKELV